ncbi:MAG: hypothetical protein AAFX08_08360 [Pseudomonadota bacterium]
MVTLADIRTPTQYYPINETVGRIRRDILFAGLSFAALTGAALWLYFDLWFDNERLIMAGIIVVSLIIGSQVSMLQLDARGFPARVFIGRAGNIRKIFDAISLARARSTQGAGGGFEPDCEDYGE